MPNSKHQLVRLLSAVICSSLALWFTWLYSVLQQDFYERAYKLNPDFDIQITSLVMLFIDHGFWVFIIPVSALIFGIWLLYQRPQSLVVFECAIFCTWLFTLIVIGFWLIGWHVLNIDLDFQLLKTPHPVAR